MSDELKGKETAEGRINRLATALNVAMSLAPDLRLFSTGTKITVHPSNGHYYDPGLDHVAEFAKAFDAYVGDEPEIPFVSSEYARNMMLSYVERAKKLAEDLKFYSAGAAGAHDPGGSLLLIRLQLCQEELAELAEAIADRDIVACLDALTDMAYVGDGTYLTLGLGHYKLAAYAEVHRSNMSKLDRDGRPILSEAGRVVKGPDYSPPDLLSVLGFPKEE